METVSVKLVVFKHPEPARWDTYCSYCPELQYFFGRGETVNEVVEQVHQTLLEELQNRNAYKNLHNLGWNITDTSIKVSIFTDEEAVSLTEQSYEVTISNYQIVKIDVEVPPARKLW